MDYFIDNKEEITLYIQDTDTEIEYMGEITEGYTKNGYKYSYYVETVSYTHLDVYKRQIWIWRPV